MVRALRQAVGRVGRFAILESRGRFTTQATTPRLDSCRVIAKGCILPVPFSATVTVAGDPVSLQGFRLRVRELLDQEKVEDYRELHTLDKLDWRFRLKDGVPFPAFVETSAEFPDVQVRVEWTRPAEGQTSVATIQNGSVTQQAAAPGEHGDDSQPCYDLRVAADGQLVLALVARAWRDGALIGYVLSADQHAWFHIARDGDALILSASDGMEAEWAERWTVSDGHAQYQELGDREAVGAGMLKALEKLARDLCSEWIWFAASPPEDIVVERQR
jgi:hypothetical protein